MKMQPTYVVLDTGCTRSMVSLKTLERFMSVAQHHGITLTWRRCHTVMSFANAGKAVLKWMAEITFPTKPKPTTTTIDCLPEGEVPILFSLEQMCNLQIDLCTDLDRSCIVRAHLLDTTTKSCEPLQVDTL